MNPGQQQFFDFILERTQEDKKEEAKAMLEANFAKQASGSFDMEELKVFNAKMLTLLKPEAVEEVANIFNNFGSQHTN